MYREEIQGQGQDLEDVRVYVVHQGDVGNHLHELPHIVLLKQLGDPGSLSVLFDRWSLTVCLCFIECFHYGKRLYNSIFSSLIACIEGLVCG